jgi:hypothetical protein
MSFSDARLLAGEIRKNGIARMPNSEVNTTFLRDRSIDSILSGAAFPGKEIALVGQMALHVKQ